MALVSTSSIEKWFSDYLLLCLRAMLRLHKIPIDLDSMDQLFLGLYVPERKIHIHPTAFQSAMSMYLFLRP
ncbi:MAG: hypothetical protein KDD58_16450, partial [Bdellovibrionales bacterium]|nr:hypothetical protein [Bdellovibrionales bacterium]